MFPDRQIPYETLRTRWRARVSRPRVRTKIRCCGETLGYEELQHCSRLTFSQLDQHNEFPCSFYGQGLLNVYGEAATGVSELQWRTIAAVTAALVKEFVTEGSASCTKVLPALEGTTKMSAACIVMFGSCCFRIL